jgi:hypothetical protein
MTTPPPLEYRNRRTGLLLFGIFEIILGAICALFIPLILFARMVARQQVYASQPPPPLAPAIAIYGLLAVALIWLGVGSILARRWARALLLCASAVALCVGVIAGVLGAFMMPQIWSAMAQSGQPAIPPAAFIVVKVITAIVMLVIYIIIPGGLFLFYRSSHVKRTCEMLDPVDRWTDRCPLPVLALCLVSAFGGAMMLGMMAAIKAFPLFGLFVSGGWCTALMLVLAGLQFFLAAGLYRLQIRA